MASEAKNTLNIKGQILSREAADELGRKLAFLAHHLSGPERDVYLYWDDLAMQGHIFVSGLGNGTFVARNWDPNKPILFELDEEEVHTLAAVLSAYQRARRKRLSQSG
jgi:hypothetical protein